LLAALFLAGELVIPKAGSVACRQSNVFRANKTGFLIQL
jgi:hypothetical protein